MKIFTFRVKSLPLSQREKECCRYVSYENHGKFYVWQITDSDEFVPQVIDLDLGNPAQAAFSGPKMGFPMILRVN